MSNSVRTVAGLTLSVLTASVGTSAANVALPALVDGFAATPGQVQWVVVAYLLGMTASSVAVGSLGDRWGRRRVLVSGIALFTVAGLVGAVAPALVILVLARVVQGVGAAVMTALPLALARDLSAEGRTGRVMGLLGTTSAVGTAAGPALGGVLIGWSGWSAAFWVMVALGAASLLAALTMPAAGAVSRTDRRFDTAGNVLLAASVSTYALALTAPAADWPTLPLLIGAAVLVGGLIAVERRAAHPVLPSSTWQNRTIAAGMVTNLIVATVMMTTLVVGPYVLHDGLDLPFPIVGLVMAVGPVTSAVSGVVAGWFVDHVSPVALITASLAVMTIGAGALALLPAAWGVAGYVAALLILTPGYQLFLASNNTQVLSSSDSVQRGAIAGALALSRNLGLITGASAMGGLYAALSAGSAGSALDAGRTTFLAAALLVLFADAAALLQRDPERRRR